MRGLAAWWVVFYHFRDEVPRELFGDSLYSFFSHGNLAVDFFFELSGFVLSLRYAKTMMRFNWHLYIPFLKARIARIYPLYILILFVFIANPVAIYLWSSTRQPGPRYNLYYFMLSVPMLQNWGFTNTVAWNIPAWSISTEWAAYLLFPFYLWFRHRLANSAERCLMLIVIVLSTLAIFCYASGHDLGGDIPRLGLVRCLCEFGAGVLLYGMWAQWKATNRKIPLVLTLVAFGLIGCYILGVSPDFLTMPLAFALIIFVGAVDSAISRILSWRMWIALGDISYATYMVHYLIKDWVKFFIVRPGVPPSLTLAVYAAAVFLASVFLYKSIERPGRRWVRQSKILGSTDLIVT